MNAKMYRPVWLAALTAVAVTAAACDSSESTDTSARTSSASSQTYQPDIDPADFVEVVDNPYFPLRPGTVIRLRGATEDGIELETITVTGRTKKILGVATTVVKDVVVVDGEVAESTFDWYAQDRDGNVWYFGEDTAEYEDGKVTSREGSWKSGVDGALPGIIMNADPQVTDSYRQEFYADEAEDMYWVVATGESVRIPFGRFDQVVRALEWTPLEPNVVVEKFYAPGVGLISERALSGPKEVVRLTAMRRPRR